MPTFKKEYPTLMEDIVTECDIYSADGHKFHTERALWDTGADTTIISSRIVRELNLQPFNQGGISGIGGATGTNVYLVHVLVPTGDFVTSVEVMESDFEDVDVEEMKFPYIACSNVKWYSCYGKQLSSSPKS